MGKFCKVLEMKRKTHTPVDLKFIFEKIRLKALHYIQHDLICQRPGLGKDQISMFKSLPQILSHILMVILKVTNVLCLINSNHQNIFFSIFLMEILSYTLKFKMADYSQDNTKKYILINCDLTSQISTFS